MLTAEDNELLCRVEGDAPMGQLMRRHWMPACLSEEVAERDGTPVRVRLLGEDLVAFRDTDGRLGVLDEHCPHRRASLALGRNEECGLRCLYHGWKIDVEGNVVDRPSRAARQARSGEKVKHRTYPCREAGGFVWVWMGRPSDARVRAAGVGARRPAVRTSIVKIHVGCNWAQVLEGAIDSAHSSSLHSTDMVPAHGRRRRRDRERVAAAVDRQGAAAAGAAHRLRLPLCRDTPADRERRRPTTTCASRCSSRRSPC